MLRGISPAPAWKLWGGWAFALCARGWGVRFPSGLRTDPAPLGGGWAPRDRARARREALGRMSFRAVREGMRCSLPERASDRSRSARGVGSAGSVLRPHGSSGEDGLSRCARGDEVRSLPELGRARSRSARVGCRWAGCGGILAGRFGWGTAGGVRWGRCLARGRFGRIHAGTWRHLIVRNSAPADPRVVPLPVPALVRVVGRVRVRGRIHGRMSASARVRPRRRCRRSIRRAGRLPGSG